ncbi:MAG TPA: hypothetical protein VFH70_08755, partial [Acidimicrobiales bacterium]|nr:hypothetical protein [Acidimicrobiales bacterium]
IRDFSLAAAGELNVYDDGLFGLETTQDILNGLTFNLSLQGGGKANEDHRVYRVTLDVNYIDAPTVTGLALVDPLDVTKTTKPRFTWVVSSDDGLPQYAYRAVVWALDDINLFPGGRAAFEADPKNIFGNKAGGAVFASGGVSFTGTDGQVKYSKAWNPDDTYGTYPGDYSVSSSPSFAPNRDLAGAGSYVIYVQAAAYFSGTTLAKKEGTASYAKLDFTMNLTPPAAPTSVSAAWQYPKAAAPNNTAKYATRVDVAVPAQALNGFTGRRVQVEHRLKSGNDTAWRVLPVGTKEAGSSAGTYTFYDTLTLPGTQMEYRARTILWDATYTLPSSTYTAAAAAVTPAFDTFVLRNPLDADEDPVQLYLEGDFAHSEAEAVGAFRGLGSDRPVFVADRLTGKSFPMRARLPHQYAATQFENLRKDQKTLVLQTDMDGEWYWVRFGPEAETTVLRQTNRKDYWKRTQIAEFTLAETYPVAGQPAIWF